MSEDGWDPTPASSPAPKPATTGFGTSKPSGFGGMPTTEKKGESGEGFAGGSAATSAFGGKSTGFGVAQPATNSFGGAPPEKKTESGGTGFGGGSFSTANAFGGKSSGIGVAQPATNSFGGAPPEKKTESGGTGFGGGSFSTANAFGGKSSGIGVAQPATNRFGGESKGFGGAPPGNKTESGGTGFGGGSFSTSSAFGGKPSGFGTAQPATDGFGGKGFGAVPAPTTAPIEKKDGEGRGFGGGAPVTSSGFGGVTQPSGFGALLKSGFGGGEAPKSIWRRRSPENFNGDAKPNAFNGGQTTNKFGGESSASGGSKGFGGTSFGSGSAAPASTGTGAPPAPGGGFGGPSAATFGSAKSTGFGKSAGGFGGAGFGTSLGGEKKPNSSEGKTNAGVGFGIGGFGTGSEFGGATGGSAFGGGETSFGGAAGETGFGGGTSFGAAGFGGAGTGGDRPRGCFNCGQEGHRSSECTQPKKERGNACYNCGEEGHRSAECSQPKKERVISCFNCGQEGHSKTECTQPPKPREDGSKPPSTFIPPEEEAETLYHSGVEKGSLFERFFDATVTTMRGGIDNMEKAEVFETFSKLGLGDKMHQNIVQCGYTKPTPVQQHAMPIIKAGHDLLACAQTGSGKTAAFLLPVMCKLQQEGDHATSADIVCSPRCMVIAPTRELAVQIYNEARKFSYGTMMTCQVVYGGTHVGHQRSLLMKGATIVVGTTGRLKQFVDEGTICLKELRFLILDEADRMLDMGFGDDINHLASSMPDKKKRQTLMFSATFPPEVQVAARHLLKDNYVMVTIDAIGAANKCITQELIKCDRSEKKDKLMELLEIDKEKYTISKQADIFTKKTLIFVSKKAFADTLAAIVSTAGIPSTTIHGDRLQNERHEALRDFASGRKAILIATAVAERGLDIKGVDHVINYDLPDELDSYVHRIGRTGRVGNSGRATSFYNPTMDQKLAAGLMKCMEDAEQVVPDWLRDEVGGGAISGGFNVGGGFGAAAAAAPTETEEDW